MPCVGVVAEKKLSESEQRQRCQSEIQNGTPWLMWLDTFLSRSIPIVTTTFYFSIGIDKKQKVTLSLPKGVLC